MFCKNCGSYMDDGSAFCGTCGVAVDNAANNTVAVPAPTQNTSVNNVYYDAPTPRKERGSGKRSKVLVIALAAVIVVQAVFLILFMCGVFGGSSGIGVPDSLDSDLVGKWGVNSRESRNEMFVIIDDDGNVTFEFSDDELQDIYEKYSFHDAVKITCGTDGNQLVVAAETTDGSAAVKAVVEYKTSGDKVTLNVTDSLVDLADMLLDEMERNEGYRDFDLSYNEFDYIQDIVKEIDSTKLDVYRFD